MPQILIRNIKPATCRWLKNRAPVNGRSLQGEIRTILERATNTGESKLTRKEFIRRVDAFRRQFRGRKFSDSTEIIRQHRYGGEG